MAVNVPGKVFPYGGAAAVSMLMLVVPRFQPADLTYIITEGGVIKDKSNLWEFRSLFPNQTGSAALGIMSKLFCAVASRKSPSAVGTTQAQRRN